MPFSNALISIGVLTITCLQVACAQTDRDRSPEYVSQALSRQAETASHGSRVLMSGRLGCPLNPISRLQGDVDDSGRYFAVAVKCREGRWLQDFIEIVDYAGSGRSVRHRGGEQFEFLPDGRLLTANYNALMRTEDHPGNLWFRVWAPPYQNEAESFLIYAPDGQFGEPFFWSVSPDGGAALAGWLGNVRGGRSGALQAYRIESEEINLQGSFSVGDIGWLQTPESFAPVNGVWLNEELFVLEGFGVNPENSYSSYRTNNFSRRVVVMAENISLVSNSSLENMTDPAFRFSETNRNWDDPSVGVNVGSLVEVLPNGLFVLRGGVNAQPEAPDNFDTYYELQVRSADGFRFIGGIEQAGDSLRASSRKTVNSFDFSPDGEMAYIIRNQQWLEIYQTNPWNLTASLPTNRMGERSVFQVLTTPLENQIILVSEQNWSLIELIQN